MHPSLSVVALTGRRSACACWRRNKNAYIVGTALTDSRQ